MAAVSANRTAAHPSHGPRWRALGARSIWLLVLLLFTVFFVLPAAWLLLAPTKTDQQLVTLNPLAFGSLANVATAWQNLLSFQNGVVFDWLQNSLLYTGCAMVLTLVASVPAGYGVAMLQFPGRRILLGTTLLVMIMPASALALPLFLEMTTAHLENTVLAVILPFAFFPFGVYLVYLYYSTALPAEILQSARVDGATEWRVFRHVALPLAKPVIAMVAFFNLVTNWNNFFLPFVMLPSSIMYPLPVGLQDLLSSTPAFNPTIGGAQLHIYRPELALATLFAIAPVLIVFLFFQRFLVAGTVSGSTKE
ncbi:MAG: carbohydrate ABC transporter permease [Candidatus Dormiibacterota bacterium]